MDMGEIFTVGYEGGDIESLTRTLRRHKIEILIDVREMPLSRKKGLSKTALAATMESEGVRYVHDRALGAPRPIRDALRATKDYAAYFKRFEAYMDTVTDHLKAVAEQYTGRVALLCFEADPLSCHRSVVARRLGKMVKKTPRHLSLETDDVDHAARLHSRQGVPAR